MLTHQIIDNVVDRYIRDIEELKLLDIELNKISQEFSIKRKSIEYYAIWFDDVKEARNRLKSFISITAPGTQDVIIVQEIGSDCFINKFRDNFTKEIWEIIAGICRDISYEIKRYETR